MTRLVPFALAALALGCTTTAEVPWDVHVSDPALAQRAAVIETSVRRGGCEGVLVYRAAIARDRRGPPPSLGRGLHGFAAEARDADCNVIARACVERDLPLAPGARVQLELEETIPEPACSPSQCREGECETDDAAIAPDDDAGSIPPDDAGPEPMDATPDGGAVTPDAAVPTDDAGMELDAGVDPGVDAGAADCAGSPFGDHCYELHADAREWSAAEAVCATSGAHLTSLGGPEEESFVRGLAGTARYWIGLNDLASEGIWQWADGSSSSHRDWAGGAASNREQNDCVADTPGTGWSVLRCRETHPFVCER